MLNTDTHCEMITKHIGDKSKAMDKGFKLFVQMFSAIVGGSIAIRLQYGVKIPDALVTLSNALAALVVIASALIILDAFRSWYAYRNTLSRVAGKNKSGNLVVPPPRFWFSCGTLLTMLMVMAIALAGFICFNPLQIPN